VRHVTVIGGGLAGCEAAWMLARWGVDVSLHEMRPAKMTEVHRTGRLAELVCSNSLKAVSTDRGPGLLKEEMRILGSLVLECADRSAVPAGSALAVDREAFASAVERRIGSTDRVRLIRDEVTALPAGEPAILATGPHTSQAIADELRALIPFGTLRFYDAVSPIVAADSIDRSIVFEASRYEKGEPGYLNCPFAPEEYDRFYDALVSAESASTREYPVAHFEGCLPIEEMARRGRDAPRFGPMKPVGLIDPRTDKRPWAVCQLRQENLTATMYNMVGFQTGLKWGEQERVFRLIPGLEGAEFLRFGVMHRNLFIDAPRLLDPFMRLRERPDVFVAGQLSGVEGYVESALSGMYCGINAARLALGLDPVEFPAETLSGGLMRQISRSGTPDFQPMNANFGLLPQPQNGPKNKKDRREQMVQAALAGMRSFQSEHGPREE